MHWLALALALALGPAIVNGFSRFCYALVLPSMQAALGWSYARAGWLNGANAVGYLVGALIAPRVLRRYGARRVFVACNFFTAATLVAVGFSTSYELIFALRAAAGVAGSLVFVSGGTLAASISDDARRNASCIAIYFSGIGLAMLLAGFALPPFFAWQGDAAWGVAWLILGGASLLAAMPAAWAARRVRPNASTSAGVNAPFPWLRFVPALVAYFGFGLGYIGYMTFIVALLRANGATPGRMMVVWGLLSLGTLATPYLWRRPLAHWSGASALGLGNLLTGLGAALALVSSSDVVLALSALVFGGAFLSTAAAITAFSKQELPPAAWGAGIAAFTVVFALGQIIGPAMTGWIADRTGSLGPGLGVSAAILVATSALVLVQKKAGR